LVEEEEGDMRGALLLAFVTMTAAGPAAAASLVACDTRCKVQIVIDRNVGIPVDRPLSLEILRKFAPVLRESSKQVPDWEGHTIHVIEYTGLVVTAISQPDDSVLLQSIDFSGGNYYMALGIKLGKIEGPDLDVRLGPPAETHRYPGKPLQWVYTNLEQTEVLTFDRTEDAILAVHWDFTPGD
jgi:hypothetical protein